METQKQQQGVTLEQIQQKLIFSESDVEQVEENEKDSLTLSPKNHECYEKCRIIDQEKNDKFIEENTCPVCLNLIKDTCQCQFGCSGLFGYNCISHNAINGCPFCRKNFAEDKTQYRNSVITKLNANALKLKCQNFENGCKEILKYHHELIDEHEQKCDFQIISCSAKKWGCAWKDIKKNLQNHLDECEFKQFICKFCQKQQEVLFTYPLNKIQTHLDSCENKKIPNLSYEITNKIKQLQQSNSSDNSNDIIQLLEKAQSQIQKQSEKIKYLNGKMRSFVNYSGILEKNEEKQRDKVILMEDFNEGIINFNSLENLKNILDNIDNKYVKGVRWNENNLQCYQFSFKSETDFTETLKQIEQLAKNGEKYSQYSLARLYIFGDKDIPRNVEKSLYWVNKSIEQNCAEGKYLLGRIQHNSTERKPSDFDSLLDLVDSASQLNNPEAKNFLGFVYGKGEGMQQNQKKALLFYKKAASQGNFAALLNLGSYYEGGYGGLEVNPEVSFNYFEKSAKKGYVNAMIKVVQLLRAGKGVEKDDLKALKWEERIQYHTMHYTHSIQWQNKGDKQQQQQQSQQQQQ